jgi:hypothetical protein
LADHRNSDIVQADFDLALIAIGIGQSVLPKFGKRDAQVISVFLVREFLAFLVAAWIRIERRIFQAAKKCLKCSI